MGHKKSRGGFTLAELLIVVAIIGILVAVAIPVFSSTLDKTKEATCLANRTMLHRELIYMEMLNGEPTNGELYSSQDPGVSKVATKTYVCPAKGIITAEYKAEIHIYNVKCSIHDPDGKRLDFAGMITESLNKEDGLKKKLKDLLIKYGKDATPRVDSTAPDGGYYAGEVKKYLEEVTHNTLGVGMSKTWSLSPLIGKDGNLNKYQVYWSSVDITACAPGDEILAMRYNSDYQGKPSYIACWVKVEENTLDGKTFSVVSQKDSGFKNVNDKAGKTFEEAYKEFEYALTNSENGSGVKKK